MRFLACAVLLLLAASFSDAAVGRRHGEGRTFGLFGDKGCTTETETEIIPDHTEQIEGTYTIPAAEDFLSSDVSSDGRSNDIDDDESADEVINDDDDLEDDDELVVHHGSSLTDKRRQNGLTNDGRQIDYDYELRRQEDENKQLRQRIRRMRRQNQINLRRVQRARRQDQIRSTMQRRNIMRRNRAALINNRRRAQRQRRQQRRNRRRLL